MATQWTPGCRECIVVDKDQEDSEDRCTGNYHGKRCWFHVYVAADGQRSVYCIKHSPTAISGERQRSRRNYNLQCARQQQEIDELAGSPQLLSLTEEIAILRHLATKELNRCTDDAEYQLRTPRIADLMDSLRSLVVTCQAVAIKSRYTLDANTVSLIVDGILGVLSTHVNDERIFQAIEVDISELLEKALDPTETATTGAQQLAAQLEA